MNELLPIAARIAVQLKARGETIAVLLRPGLQITQVHVPVDIGRDDDDLETGHDGAGGIGTVRRGRNQHDVASRITA